LGQGIGAIRGSVQQIDLGWGPIKVLPTIHPAALFRQWSERVVVLADLEKAVNESHSPHFSFDNTELWINPTLADLREFDDLHMERATECAADIETKRGQITAISFSPTPDVSLAIPFWVEGANHNYWPTPAEELTAWSFVRKWMERDDLVKVFQNGLYDLQYLASHCTPRNCSEDTMLAHHSLYTEQRKGLGFLGSLYANVPSWKSMRTFKKEEQLKAND
jgi:DNA polymerase I-like protein with 3'-5' exonuclease and polymerase domains